MINSIESRKSTRFGFVKITWTANGDLRVKVPVDCNDEFEQRCIQICRLVVEGIGPTEMTLRGKFRPDEDNTVTLYNDSKTVSKVVSVATMHFPILIEIREDGRGLKKGTEMVVLHPNQIPSGVSFKVLKTNCQLLRGMTKDEINHQAYTDVLERDVEYADNSYF